MSLTYYEFHKKFKFIWVAELHHMIFGKMRVGFGLTKRQACLNIWR